LDDVSRGRMEHKEEPWGDQYETLTALKTRGVMWEKMWQKKETGKKNGREKRKGEIKAVLASKIKCQFKGTKKIEKTLKKEFNANDTQEKLFIKKNNKKDKRHTGETHGGGLSKNDDRETCTAGCRISKQKNS